ncbi:MAG: Veg family protein [Lachnospiraceae bacterium]|nr:Veg family protein [Lachnospiraceae bacterium]
MSQTDIKKVKLSVDKNIGNRIKIRANRGRHKIDITEGVICETYPSIFLIEVENELDEGTQKISFSYTDVLTKDVRMQLI